MKLLSFLVRNYRSIIDSGWIDVDNFNVLIGKNEAGKTCLLKALHKLKPFRTEPFEMSREWPKGENWKERNQEFVVVRGRFEIDADDKKALSFIGLLDQSLDTIEIGRRYNGSYVLLGMTFHATTPNDVFSWLVQQLLHDTTLHSFGQDLMDAVQSAFNLLINKPLEEADLVHFSETVRTLLDELQELEEDTAESMAAQATLEGIRRYILTAFDITQAQEQAAKTLIDRMPTFIYMDNYRIFTGEAALKSMKEKDAANSTLLMMMKMAGIDLETELERCASSDQEDKDAQNLDISAASQHLTDTMKGRWSQGEFTIEFRINGYSFHTYVKDNNAPKMILLEERSRGFQWFFSFDLMFMHETEGTFKGSVILLDEPGLYLHIEAQRDLVKRMRSYAQNNQLIYTTHLPFMLDPDAYAATRFVIRDPGRGTWVTDDPGQVDPQSKFPFQAAFGLKMGNSFLFQPQNLVVEGTTDFWYLDAMSHACEEAGKEALDSSITITPSGGATEAAYIASILKGQKLNVVVLLDSDAAGDEAVQRLVYRWLLDDQHVLQVGKATGTSAVEIEDLFDIEFYLRLVNECYAKELGRKTITLKDIQATAPEGIVDQIDAALVAKGVAKNLEGKAFNKGRVAKRLVKGLGNGTVSVPEVTLDCFALLFQKINAALRGKK